MSTPDKNAVGPAHRSACGNRPAEPGEARWQTARLSAFAPETEEQKDARMAADGWHAWVYNGVKQYWRMATDVGTKAVDGGYYCPRCNYYYVGENRCPRH